MHLASTTCQECSHLLSYLILMTTLWGERHAHFMGKETEAQGAVISGPKS